MLSRLPPWVEYGAFTLALVAGCINAIGLLGVEHQAISHLSGTATLLGTSLSQVSMAHSAQLLAVLISFLLGAVVSGLLLRDSALKLGRHYETLLLLEAVLLTVALLLLENNSVYGQYFASAACGMQNALVTTYSGAVIRTTHLTGLFTDLGLLIGGWLRGESFDKRKLILFLLIIVGFIGGGSLGAWLFSWLHFVALSVPAVICAVLALLYHRYRVRLT
ncbi:hypothetical protein BGP77_07250 [Saccharospirillum sp. MSK14-1]|uniref:YoaK family protein n=1 Tax=Saccharospirillum sp. MSK14-1 TaxID=1897632 RepID=UPI000D37B7AD|nr:YoaK family protein [Saccharospirillum sp. MSK14-1]PTY37069.1 hypothetical protein BGP77_07250 [Saccharospirillum sp. MSK14-1]